MSAIYGTYCGFVEFDGVRYWDGRHLQAIKINLNAPESSLQSDFRNRTDLVALKNGNLALAQEEKERVEEFQRADAKLRLQFKKTK